MAEAGRHRCEYCLTPESIVGYPKQVDHIQPEPLGGATVEDNLCLACAQCNNHKNDRTHAVDPETDELALLFHPRRHVWGDHFRWTTEGERLIGITPTGRATVTALELNRAALVRARLRWASVGWHLPKD